MSYTTKKIVGFPEKVSTLFDLVDRTTIGFDRIFERLDMKTQQAFPPFNITKLKNDHYQVDLAVAGYTEKDLKVETRENKLYITGSVEQYNNHVEAEIEKEYPILYKGIAARKFERVFDLANGTEVVNVTLAYGILTILLKTQDYSNETKVYDITVGS